MELLDALRLRHRVESMHLVGHLQFVERFICALCVLVDSRTKGHWLRRANVKTRFFFPSANKMRVRRSIIAALQAVYALFSKNNVSFETTLVP